MSQLRLVYEALMIAKTCSILQDHPLVDKWIAGETIYFSKAVLGRIRSPALDELRNLWPLLYEHSHATVYSIQVETKYEKIKDEIPGVLVVIGMLISCNFHLLNRHFVTRSMVYLGKRYFGDGTFVERRDVAKIATKELEQILSGAAKHVVREYAATWHVALG